MAKRYINSAEYYNTHSPMLTPLVVGDAVLIQNQAGNHPNRWEKTGHLVEDLKDQQYHIKVDGSNRITLRNGHFLCLYTPITNPHQAPNLNPFHDSPVLCMPAETQSTQQHSPSPPDQLLADPEAPSGNPIPAEKEMNQGKELILTMPVNDKLIPQPALPQGNPPSVQQQTPLPTSPPVLTTTQAPERLVERWPAQAPIHHSKCVTRPPRSLSPIMHGQSWSDRTM